MRMALNYSISRASAAAQNTGKGIAGRARKNAENRTHGRIIGRVMMALADIVANPYIPVVKFVRGEWGKPKTLQCARAPSARGATMPRAFAILCVCVCEYV